METLRDIVSSSTFWMFMMIFGNLLWHGLLWLCRNTWRACVRLVKSLHARRTRPVAPKPRAVKPSYAHYPVRQQVPRWK